MARSGRFNGAIWPLAPVAGQHSIGFLWPVPSVIIGRFQPRSEAGSIVDLWPLRSSRFGRPQWRLLAASSGENGRSRMVLLGRFEW
jgi:hypothetical protein